MEEWWEALGVTVTEASLLEILSDATSTPLLRKVTVPMGTQYELPLERKWGLQFKTTDKWYRGP